MSLTSRELTGILVSVSELCGRTVSKQVINLWFGLLSRYTFDEVSKAFSLHLEREPRFPYPSDILGILNQSFSDRALSALVKVERGMSLHGAYSTVIFDDPVIHAVIEELGGWIKSCQLKEDQFTWWKKDFRERYEHHIKHGLEYYYPSKLYGIFDMTNLTHGLPPQPPKLVGDKSKCLSIASETIEKNSIVGKMIGDLSSKKLFLNDLA